MFGKPFLLLVKIDETRRMYVWVENVLATTHHLGAVCAVVTIAWEKNTLFLNARHTFFHPSHSRGIYTDNIDVATFCLAVQYFKNMADLGLRLTSK
jgi:hypothetical protein